MARYFVDLNRDWDCNMCGIYGITENNREFIEKYIDICSHRGPDGRGIYNDNFVSWMTRRWPDS